jgi:hypothetical protein
LSRNRKVASVAMSNCPTATQRFQSPARPPATTTTQIEARMNHVMTMFLGASSKIRSVCQPKTISRAGSNSSSRSLVLTFPIKSSIVLHIRQWILPVMGRMTSETYLFCRIGPFAKAMPLSVRILAQSALAGFNAHSRNRCNRGRLFLMRRASASLSPMQRSQSVS